MDGVSVRAANIDDLGALLELYRELAGDREQARGADAAISAPVLEQILAQHGRHLLVARAHGRPLGTADLSIVSNLTHHAHPWAIVENVVVAEAARRRGVGRALLQRVIELARAEGCYKLQLLSRKQRSDAHAFYASFGLEPVAEGLRLYFE